MKVLKGARLMLLIALVVSSALASAAPEETVPTFTRQQDVVYGRSFGTALTMDVFEPKTNPNGATVVWVISGGWFSSHDSINPDNAASPVKPLTDRGYRVCAVVHRSNPYFTVEDAINDINRAIRFIRYRYGNGKTNMPIGIMGGSAGGHLSLMAGTTGDDGRKSLKDPVERLPSRVQAVGCYFPPTDFLNYGKPGVNGLETVLGKDYQAPFEFKRFTTSTKTIDEVTSPALKREIMAQVSPANHVTADDAPTLIIHGDADSLVPIQQAHWFIDKMESAAIECKLITKPGAGHGWFGMEKDNERLYDWMDSKLLKK